MPTNRTNQDKTRGPDRQRSVHFAGKRRRVMKSAVYNEMASIVMLIKRAIWAAESGNKKDN